MLNKYQRILLIGSGIWYLGEGMLGPLYTIFAQQIGGDILDITGAWATYLFTLGILTIVFGRFSDKIDKRKMMVAGYAINAAFTFAYLFVDTPFKLFIIQIGLGSASALATPTWDALYAEYEDRKKAGVAWGLADGMPHLITGASIIIGGIIISFYSFAVLFIIMGVIQTISALYQAKILYMKKYRD